MLNIVTEKIKNNVLNNVNNSNADIASGATYTYPGSCSSSPGSYTDSYTVTSSGFSGSATFNHYCEGDASFSLTMYGKINYSATYVTPVTTSPPILKTFSFNVEYLRMTLKIGTDTYSEEFSGSVAVVYDGVDNYAANIESMTISTTFKANGFTYKIVDLQIDTSSSLAISGTFYHPVHGYVTVSTPAGYEFALVPGDPDKYCGGVLEMTGTDGASPPVSTTVEFEADSSCSNYRICVRPTTDTSCLAGATWNTWP